MPQTATVTLATLNGGSATVSQNGGELLIQANTLDATGAETPVQALLSSSNTNVAKVTTAWQDSGAPAAVIGVSPGSAIITATAADNSAATATLTVTVV